MQRVRDGGWGSKGDELSPVRETEAGLAPGLSV